MREHQLMLRNLTRPLLVDISSLYYSFLYDKASVGKKLLRADFVKYAWAFNCILSVQRVARAQTKSLRSMLSPWPFNKIQDIITCESRRLFTCNFICTCIFLPAMRWITFLFTACPFQTKCWNVYLRFLAGPCLIEI